MKKKKKIVFRIFWLILYRNVISSRKSDLTYRFGQYFEPNGGNSVYLSLAETIRHFYHLPDFYVSFDHRFDGDLHQEWISDVKLRSSSFLP